MPPVGIIVILAAIAVFGIFVWRKEQQRRQALLAWAAARRWRFQRKGLPDLRSRFPGLKILDRGHSRSNGNVITGTVDGREVLCLDYKYVTGSGKNRSTHSVGMVIMDCGFPTIPLLIRREHVFDKVGEFLGADDIDFESVEFSRRFYVKSNDRKWAYDIIHSRTMDYLMQAPALNIEFGMGAIAVYRSGYNNPAQHEEALKVASTMLDLIPDYVVKQMVSGDGWQGMPPSP